MRLVTEAYLIKIPINILLIGVLMSAGLEIRGKSMRIWIKPNSSEPIIRETLAWPFTPENVEKAKKLAGLIKLEIELDQFNLAKHFPTILTVRGLTPILFGLLTFLSQLCCNAYCFLKSFNMASRRILFMRV